MHSTFVWLVLPAALGSCGCPSVVGIRSLTATDERLKAQFFVGDGEAQIALLMATGLCLIFCHFTFPSGVVTSERFVPPELRRMLSIVLLKVCEQ